MNTPPKVEFICGDHSGPYYHDIGVPMEFFHKYKLLECGTTSNLAYHALKDRDVVFFQRQYAVESLNLIKILRQHNIATIAHCDDNVWELPRSNPAYSTYQGDTVDRFNEILAAAHVVTTSTPYLAKHCAKQNKNVILFRNLVDMSITKFRREDRDNPNEIRIGWTGTPHHHDDILLVENAIRIILEKYPQVKFVFMGYFPPNINTFAKRNRYETYTFVEPQFFYPCLSNLDFDIGIAPLVNMPFNWGKTGRKAQEYAALKIPMVLSPVSTYEAWKSGETCLKPLKNRTVEWVRTLSEIIEDVDLRNKLRDNAYQYVTDNHSIDTFISERAEVFNTAWRIAHE